MTDVFEIRDFSLASPWERLISAIEEQLRTWLPSELRPSPCTALITIDGVPRDHVLLLCHDSSAAWTKTAEVLPRFMSEMLDCDSEFASIDLSEDIAQRLRRWFNVSSFVVLTPVDGNPLDADEMASAQGALNVALANCKCSFPSFVVHDVAQGALCGRAYTTGEPSVAGQLSCRFDVARFDAHEVPAELWDAAGLLTLFRSKVSTNCSGEGVGIDGSNLRCSLARCHTFVLSRWPAWRQPQVGPPGLQLRFGSDADPVPELALAAQWPRCTERELAALSSGDAADGASGGGDDVRDATRWTVQALPKAVTRPPSATGSGTMVPGDALDGRLVECVSHMFAMCDDIAHHLDKHALATSATSATSGNISIDTLLQSVTADGGAVLSTSAVQETLRRVLDDSLPAPVDGASSGPSEGCSDAATGRRSVHIGLLQRLGLAALQLAAAPHSPRRPHAGCALLQLWRGALAELRRLWDLGAHRLPYLHHTAPEAASPPLEQEVQMIGCCAHMRWQRAHAQGQQPSLDGWWPARPMGPHLPATVGRAIDEPTDDESVSLALEAASFGERDGACAPLPGLFSRGNGAQLWSAYTQPAGPRTYYDGALAEATHGGLDGLAEAVVDHMAVSSAEQSTHADTEATIVEGAASRHASAQLKSGMQAFKAANPGCTFEDFVRWRSPSDWIEPSAAVGDGVGEEGTGSALTVALCGGSEARCMGDSSDGAGDADRANEAGGALAKVVDSVASCDETDCFGTADVAHSAAELTVNSADGNGSPMAAHPRSLPPTTPPTAIPLALPSESGGGRLSGRFEDPTHLWRVLWEGTQPLAAAKQRPLFDAEREAQVALDRLDRLSSRPLLAHLLHATIDGALAALATSPFVSLSPRAPAMLDALSHITRQLHTPTAPPVDWRASLLDDLREVEWELLRAASLQAKFGPVRRPPP